MSAAYANALQPTVANAQADPAPGVEASATPDLMRLKRMFAESRDLTQQARTEALTDQDYYDGKQWSAAELTALAARHQPDIVINRVKPAINGIVGVTERGKSEPRAFPRGPDDEDSADTATDVLQYIAETNRFDRTKQDCFLDMLIPGSMAAQVTIGEDNQVEIVQVRWEEFFYDPRSRRRDFADARYKGVAKWMYADDAASLWPDSKSDIDNAVAGGSMVMDQSFADRPNGISSTVVWVDRRSRRLMVIELYYREAGQWMRACFHTAGIFEAGPSPFHDHKGRPDCPIEAMSAYIDKDNNRYGAVRDMRGPQDEVNKRRSKLLHLLSVSQIQAVDPSAIDVNADVARAEAARPDGVIPFGWQKVSTSAMAEGQAQLLQEAKAEIERMGPNPAVLGRSSEDASGRALLARQQAGLVELALLYGALEDWELRIYRQCWARAKQYWTAPQFVRVTDDENSPKFVGINQPIMGQPSLGVHPDTGQAQLMPNVLGYKNDIGEMDVDIVLETTQDLGTLAQEQFTELMQLISSNPVWQQQISLDTVLSLSTIPHKRQLRDKIKAAAEQAQQANAQQMALAQAGAEAKVGEIKSKTVLNTATAESKLADAHVNAIQTGLDAAPSAPPPIDPNNQQAAADPTSGAGAQVT